MIFCRILQIEIGTFNFMLNIRDTKVFRVAVVANVSLVILIKWLKMLISWKYLLSTEHYNILTGFFFNYADLSEIENFHPKISHSPLRLNQKPLVKWMHYKWAKKFWLLNHEIYFNWICKIHQQQTDPNIIFIW